MISQLAEKRRAKGFTQESLAERLGKDRTTIGRWERGEVAPYAWNLPPLAEALGITLDELARILPRSHVEFPRLLAETGEDNVRRREMLTGALATGVAVAAAVHDRRPRSAAAFRPDGSTGGYVAGLVQAMREQDDVAPTGSLLPMSGQLVALAEQLVLDARDRDKRDIGRAAAEAAMLHWWLIADAGGNGGTARDRAVAMAVEWDMPEIVGHMFGWRSGLALADGDLRATVQLARRAREPQWRLSPGSIGWSSNYEVRAQALLGDTDGLKLALDVSQEAHDAVNLDEEPPWMYWLEDMLEPNQLDLHLLRHGPDAVQPLEDVLARYPAGRERDVAWYRAHIASARAWADDIEGAAKDAEEAARLSAATGTNWTMGEIEQLSARPHLALLREVLADVH